MKYTKRQIREAISYWRKRLDESVMDNPSVDEVMLEEILTDHAGFEFAEDVGDALRGRQIDGMNCQLEPDSVDELRRRLGEVKPWKKTYLCGVVKPNAYSVDAMAESCGYEELDAGAEPQDDDERKYLEDRQRWYDDIIEDYLYTELPDEAFGQTLNGEKFLLKASRPNGEGVGLLCRIVSFW